MSRGMVFNIQHYSIHDGPGIRTTVFLKGCPLRCGWCHNPEGLSPDPELVISSGRCVRSCRACVEVCPQKAIHRDSMDPSPVRPRPAPDETEPGGAENPAPRIDRDRCIRCGACASACPAEALLLLGRSMTAPEVVAEVEKDRVFYDESGGGVTFSGGEPLSQPEFLAELLAGCRERNIHTAVDTSGFCEPGHLEAVMDRVNLFLYDLKVMDDARHRELTGQSNQLILDNLRTLALAGATIFVRIPVIPGVNDNVAECRRMVEFIGGLKTVRVVHLLPFHAIAADKYRRLNIDDSFLRTIQAGTSPPQRIGEMHDRFSAAGFTVFIGG